MEYNKDKFIKTNDKKVLHKVKKQWVVLSMSLLALLGGGAVAHQAAAHADSANRQNANPAAALKDRINASLMKAQSNSSHQTSAADQNQDQSQASFTNIRQQAVQLHNRIVSNAVLTDSQSRTNHENQNSDNAHQQTNSSAESIPSNVNRQNSASTSNNSASRSVSSSAINIKNDRADHNLDNSKVASANQTSLKANEQLNPAQHLVGSGHMGTYNNLTYTSDGSGDIEFTGGKLTYYNNGSNNNYSFLSEAPSDIKNATSIKFDSDVDSSQLTDASYMFHGGPNLASVTLPSDFGKNIKDASCIFWGSDLSNVTLPRDFGPNITNASTMFSGNFTNLTLPSGFCPNVSDASDMFASDPDLESITLPNGFGQKITNAYLMFANDKKLINLNLPSGFGQQITNGNAMFSSDGSSFANRSDNFNQLQMSDYGTPADPHHLAGHWIDAHNYRNLEYTSDGQGHIEFLKGTLSDGSNFVSEAPSDIKNATALKFDSDIDYSQFHKTSDMFQSDRNLIDLTLPNDFSKNISDEQNMFYKSGIVGNGKFYKNNNLTPMASDGYGTPRDLHQLAGHWISNVYHGVEYVSDSHNHIEFTRGTLSDGSDFVPSAPSNIKNATSLKFDSDIDDSQFSDAANMFKSDNSLTNITLPADFGQNVTNASYMFENDKNLASLNLPSGFGQNIIDALQMFQSDNSLASLNLPSDFGQNITNASDMFENDGNLASLTLPSGFGQNITNASTMLSCDGNLTSLTLPSDFGQNISYSSWMFQFDSSFYRLKRDGNTSDQLNSDSGKLLEKVSDLAGHWIDQQIQQYYGLTYKYDKDTNTIEFTKGKLNWNSSQGGFLANAPRVIRNASTIKFDGESGNSDQPNSKMDLGNLQDMANMFASDLNLKHLELNANFKSLKPTNLFNAFGEDPNLQSLDLSNLNTSAVTDMSNLFTNDSSLQSINFGSGWNTSHVTDMAAMFMNDQELTGLDLSHFDTRQVRSMLDMFSGDLNLTQLDVSKFSTANVGNMAAMFYNLPELKSLDVSSFDTAKVHDMNSMFARDNLSQIKGLDRFNTVRFAT